MGRGLFLVASAAVVFIPASYFATNSRAQVRPFCDHVWPPRPENIVNLDGKTGIPPNGVSYVFTVPPDKWFVATTTLVNPVTTTDVAFVEDIAGQITQKAGDGFLGWVQDSLGLTFAPGSQVAYQNLGSIGYRYISFHIIGYLTDL